MTAKDARHCFFNIAELVVEIIFEDTDLDISLLPSLNNFKVTHDIIEQKLFTLTVTDKDICYKGALENIRTFDTGNGDIRVERTEEGGYLFNLYMRFLLLPSATTTPSSRSSFNSCFTRVLFTPSSSAISVFFAET